MTPRIIYVVLWLDPKTGFLKREELDTHRAQTTRIQELRRQGVTRIIESHFTRE